MTWHPQTFQPINQGWQPSSFTPDAPEQNGLSEGVLPRIVGGALALGQGAMPLFDEAGAYGGAVLEGFGSDIAGTVGGKDLEEVYDRRLKNIRGVEKAFTAENPNTDLALRLTGAVGSALPVGGAIAARPVLSGLALGAGQGFTGSEGGFGDRLGGAAVGGTLGSGAGVVADRVAGPIVNYAGQKLGKFAAPALDLAGRELKNIKNNLSLGGITPQQYAERLLKSSSDDFAGELGGEALRMQTQSQAKITGPAMQSAREAMRQRLKEAPQRTRKILEDVIGPESNITDNLATIEQLKLVEPDLYQSVSGTVPRDQIADILNTPAGRQAVPDAMKNIANRTVQPAVKTAKASDLPIETAHEISKSLNSQIPRNQVTGKISDPAIGGPIEGLRKGIVAKLREASPDFDLAQTVAAEKKAFQDAVSQGRNLSRKATGEGADDLMEAIIARDASLPYAVSGYHKGLLDVLEDVPLRTGNPAARLATPKVVNRTAELLGDPAKGQQLEELLVAEKLRMELAQRGIYGSNTAETASSGLANIPLTKTSLFNSVLTKADDALHAKSNERLASALYARTPEEKKELARRLLGKDAATLIPDSAERNAMIEALRGGLTAIPVQASGSLSNIPTIRISKRRGER